MRGLSFGELLDYSAEESNHWRDFFTQHPGALDVPCDIAGTKTVREAGAAHCGRADTLRRAPAEHAHHRI